MDGRLFTIEDVDDATPEEIAREAVTEDPFFEPKVIEIIREYIQPDSNTAITHAAHSIAKHLTEPKPPRGFTHELNTLWVLFIAAGKQIPYHHPSMVKLVRLFVELRHSPRTSFVGFWDEERSVPYNIELNLFGETLREYFDPPFAAEMPEAAGTPEDARRWVNINAFCALLEQLGGQHLDHFCLWTMQDAFETTSSLPSSSHNEVAFSCRIAAAAQWIIHSGQSLFQKVRVPEDKANQYGAERVDDNHWRFWKNGFKNAAAKKDGIQDESRQLAVKAANLMDALEKNMLWT